MIHDTSGSGEDEVTELTGGEKSNNPLLKVSQANVETRADDATLVQTEIKLDTCESQSQGS